MLVEERSFFSRNKAEPLHIQVKEDIRKRILSKEWKSGDRLPSETELCDYYDVSRVTVRNAIECLQTEGYLTKRQGRGTYVNDILIEQRLSKFYSFSEEIRKKGLRELAKMNSFETVNADYDLAAVLHINPGEPVFLLERIRYIENEPYAVEKSYIPVRFAPMLDADMVQEQGLYASMNRFGLFLSSAVEELRAINVNKTTAAQLRVPENKAAIHLKRTTFSGNQVVEYCDSFVRGDILSYTVELK